MSSTTVLERGMAEEDERFRHEALFYAGSADFVHRTASFIRDSVRAQEPILVVVSADKIEMLRSELNGEAHGVKFADMDAVGQNPARIIPAWRAFVAEQSGTGKRFRGIGEPIWAARSSNELVECERHEALLNLAFDDAPAWWLACPYDTESLSPEVLREAERNHPFVSDADGTRVSRTYRGLEDVTNPFDLQLPEPPSTRAELPFVGNSEDLRTVRGRVAEAASVFGLQPERVDDLVLAVSEVATNSVRHGGGHGVLRIWHESKTLICEVRDAGRIEDPLVGRGQPSHDRDSGFGLWLANQLCDLVQIRTFEDGSVIRLHARR